MRTTSETDTRLPGTYFAEITSLADESLLVGGHLVIWSNSRLEIGVCLIILSTAGDLILRPLAEILIGRRRGLPGGQGVAAVFEAACI